MLDFEKCGAMIQQSPDLGGSGWVYKQEAVKITDLGQRKQATQYNWDRMRLVQLLFFPAPLLKIG